MIFLPERQARNDEDDDSYVSRSAYKSAFFTFARRGWISIELLVLHGGGLGRLAKSSGGPASTYNGAALISNDGLIDVKRSPKITKRTGQRYPKIDFYRPLRLEIITEEEQ